jgi:hypothetical protein
MSTKSFLTVNKKIRAAFVALVTASTFSISAFPGAASAARYDETYACVQTTPWSGGFIGRCDGTWYNADPNHRSVRIVFDSVTHSNSSGYNTTPVTFAATLDGTKKTITYYCRYANGTTSASKGTLTLGGGYPTSHTYPPGGWSPCDGYSIGVWAVVRGWYGSHASSETNVIVNDAQHPHAMWGRQCTWPDYCT